jgi:hypothetical protein
MNDSVRAVLITISASKLPDAWAGYLTVLARESTGMLPVADRFDPITIEVRVRSVPLSGTICQPVITALLYRVRLPRTRRAPLSQRPPRPSHPHTSSRSSAFLRSLQPVASISGTYAASSPESCTSSAISMIGLAGKLRTEVDPTCSMRTTRSPRVDRMRVASRS